jgi:hypothetical protein
LRNRIPSAVWLAIGLLSASAGALHAATPKLYVQETAHVKVIYYDPAHEYVVEHLMRCFENALSFDERTFHYKPSEKVAILLEDFGDYGHGGAGTVPRNFISVGLAPLNYTFETLPANERINWILKHEMIHITMADNGNSTDHFFRHLFGGKVAANAGDPVTMFYSNLTSPRHYAPRWFHEGIAVFMETWMSGGLGRALGGYDEMVFRAMVRDDAYMYDVVGLESEGTAIDFQVGANAYLYGTRFMTYLAYTHGLGKLLDWVTRSEDSKRYFATAFKEVYGVPLQVEWRRWVAAEHQWQNANLKRIRQYPLTGLKRISPQTLGSVSRSYYDPASNTIYAAVRYTGQMANLAAIHADTGQVARLQDIRGPALYFVTSVAFDPAGQRIFFVTKNSNWRDLNVFDLRTRRSRRLLHNVRTGDLAYSAADGALWGTRHNNGLTSLVRIPEPFTEAQALYTLPYGQDLFDIDVSPDGKQLTGGMTDLSGRQKLVRFQVDKLKQGDASFDVLHDFEYNTPGNFVFSPDGRYLYGSSYYTGASNLFRYDFETRAMEVVSNCETGLFRPLPLADGRLIAFEYTAKGFAPAFVDAKPLQDVSAIDYLGQATFEKYPELRKWKLPSPESIDLKPLLTYTGRYHPLKTVSTLSMYPIVQGYKNTAAGGMRFDFGDRMQIATASVTASYSPDSTLSASERVHLGLEARLWNLKLTSYYNNADFYDLFGPTKMSRKGYALKVEDQHNLLFDTPQTLDLTWSVAGYGGMDRLPDYQNVVSSVSRFVTGKVGLNYSFLEKSLGAVDDEKGTAWTLNTRFNYAASQGFPRFYATYDKGLPLPVHNSSVWLRGAVGKSFGDSQSPFANFYFGAFGNNWVDHQEISRYRQYYSFPGMDLDAIGSTSFAKAQVEWNAPPWKFKRLGTTAVYCNWARLSLFSSGLFTNLAGDPQRGVYGDIGAQLDFRIVLFTYLNSTFSAGYAAATDRQGHVSTEYMISLKIL